MRPVERANHNDKRNNLINDSSSSNPEIMCTVTPILYSVPTLNQTTTSTMSSSLSSSSSSGAEVGTKRSRSLSGESPACPQSHSSRFGNNSRATTSVVSNTNKRRRLSEVCNVLVQINPTAYIEAAFRANGHDVDMIQQKAAAQFSAPTSEMTDAYQHDIVSAFRSNDMETIQQLHANGKLTVNACNRFGESVLHIACRRGNAKLVRFLIETVGMDAKTIRDDYHRTVLHDACWTNQAASEVVDVLLEHCPEHALLKDVRGFTPFDYTRSQDHGKWLRFLWERKARLNPSERVG
jgi:hypothetical protein